MPTSDGKIGHRDLCTAAVVERTIGPASVSSLKIAASLQSDNFVAGSAGWKIERDTGSAEFQDVIVRGTLNGADLIANTVTTAKLEVTASLIAGQTVESTTYTPGSAGWQIDADGSAEFDNVTVRGTIEASSIEGNVTLGTNGVFRSGSSGARVEMVQTTPSLMDFYNATVRIASIGFDSVFGGFSLKGVTGQDIEINSGNDMTIDAARGIVIRSAGTGDINLITAGGNLFVDSVAGQVQVELGSAAAPVYSFQADTDTGMYRPGTDQMGFVTAGVQRFLINNTTLQGVGTGAPLITSGVGAVSFPAFTFIGDSDTGMYRVGANVVGFATGASLRLQLSATTLATTGATGSLLIRTDIAGTAADPLYSFWGDSDTGIYRVGVNQFGISVGNGLRLSLDTVQIRAQGGAHFVDAAPGATGTIDAQWINSGGAVRTLSEVTSMLSKKQDVVPLEDFLDTSKVLDLDLIAFRMKEDPVGPMHIGTVAASVGKHLPAMAYKRDGKWDFGSYSRLVIPLIAEVRKLRDRVNTLEAA